MSTPASTTPASAATPQCWCAAGIVNCPAPCKRVEDTPSPTVREGNSSAAKVVAATKVTTPGVAPRPFVAYLAPEAQLVPPPVTSWEDFEALVEGSRAVKPGIFKHAEIEERGLMASADIVQGARILEVPELLVMSAVHPALRRFYGDVKLRDPDTTFRLVGFLASQRRLGSASPWFRYVAHLPRLRDLKSSHPLWARQALLHRFAPLPVTHTVQKYQRMLKMDWKVWQAFAEKAPRLWAADEVVPENVRNLREVVQNVTQGDLQWAFTIVLTRGFGTPHGTALAPMADDLNTDVPMKQNARWRAAASGHMEVFATKPIKKGEELIAGYATSPRDNEAFASTWGFALEGNREKAPSLSFEDCAKLTEGVKRKPLTKQKEGDCGAPEGETQVGVFCTLLKLAREHCPYVEELRR